MGACYHQSKSTSLLCGRILGSCICCESTLGWAAADMQPAPASPPLALLAIYLGSAAWVFGYDTIYAVQDMVDDRTVGVKSSALGLGRHLEAGVSTAYGLAILGLGGGFWLLIGPGPWLGGLALMAIHLHWQIRRLRADDPAGALRLFKSNRDAGLILTAGMVLTHLAG